MSTDHVEVPDGITPVVGWRLWSLSENGLLKSVTRDYEWIPRQAQRAECEKPKELIAWFKRHGYPIPPVEWRPDAPAEECGCGFYALRSGKEIVPYLIRHGVGVVGRVALWGRVLEGDRGYRAEYAYPQALYVDIDYMTRIGGLREYGVPIFRWEEQQEIPPPRTIDFLARGSWSWGLAPQLFASTNQAAQAMAAVSEKIKLDLQRMLKSCLQCGHPRSSHGDPKYGCFECPVSYDRNLATWILRIPRPNHEFVERP